MNIKLSHNKRWWILPDGRLLPVIQGGTSANTVQQSFWFRNDDGSLTAATYIGTQESNQSIDGDTVFRIRFIVEETAGKNDPWAFQVYAQKNGSGGYTAVTATRTDGLQYADDANSIVDGTVIGTVDFDLSWSGTPQDGEYDDTASPGTGTIGLSGTYTEVEFCLVIDSTNAQNGDFWDLRLYSTGGTALDGYTVTPRVTAQNIVITQTVNQVSETDLAQPITAVGGEQPSYPQVAAQATSFESAATTSHTVSLPAGVSAGDLLIAMLAVDAGGAPFVSWPGGWTEIKDATDALGFTTLAVAYRVADGNEGSSITVTTTPSAQSAHVTYRITGHDASTNAPEISTGASGDGQLANPDSLTPGGGSKDYLWIALVSADGSGSTGPWDVTAAPTNYTDLVSRTSGGATSGTTIGVARRELTATSNDPGSFTVGDAGGKEWIAATMAIYPAAGLIGTVNQVTETDLAQPVTWSPKHRFVSQTTEVENAQAITSAKVVTVAQVSEIDLAQSITRTKTVAVGLVLETDQAQIFTRQKIAVVVQVTETNLAQGIFRAKAIAVALVTKINLAQSIARLKAKVLGQTIETDLAQQITEAGAGQIIGTVNQIIETDAAQAMASLKIKVLTQVIEIDLSQSVGSLKVKSAAQVIEADLSQIFSSLKIRVITQSIETDLAQVITLPGALVIPVNQVVETDFVKSISWNPKHRLISQMAESDSAQSLVAVKEVLVGQISENDLAQAIAWSPKHRAVNQVQELDVAFVIVVVGGLLAVGKVSMAYTAKKPGMAYTARKPEMAYMTKKPGIIFED